MAFLARLAVLVPRPRVNLVLYHGLLAPRAAWRAEVVPRRKPTATANAHVEASASDVTPRPSARGASWAELMRRAFEVDVLACPHCGGRVGPRRSSACAVWPRARHCACGKPPGAVASCAKAEHPSEHPSRERGARV